MPKGFEITNTNNRTFNKSYTNSRLFEQIMIYLTRIGNKMSKRRRILMNFETLNSGKFLSRKWVLVSISVVVLVLFVIGTYASFAKYQTVKSMAIVSGTINYKVPDFKIMAMYKNDGNSYTEIETMPTSGYVINTEKSYCTLDNINKIYNKMYTDEDSNHVIANLSKSSKCYLYFDDYKKVNTPLGEITVKLATPDFSKTSCTSGCGESTVGIYEAKDDDGWSYYYRGDVENNYVRFAGFWWRIIRINGDGSIRLIYDGTSGHANGTNTADSIAVASQTFSPNGTYNNNMYVGFKYTSGQVHGLGTKSNALAQLETWYQNNLSSYANKIDTDAVSVEIENQVQLEEQVMVQEEQEQPQHTMEHL